MSQIKQVIESMMPYINKQTEPQQQKENVVKRDFIYYQDNPIVNLQYVTSIEIYEETKNITFYLVDQKQCVEWHFEDKKNLKRIFELLKSTRSGNEVVK